MSAAVLPHRMCFVPYQSIDPRLVATQTGRYCSIHLKMAGLGVLASRLAKEDRANDHLRKVDRHSAAISLRAAVSEH